MIILVHTFVVLCLILLPLLTVEAKEVKAIVYKNNHDTANARYAINDNGYLEEISNNKVQDQD